MKAIDYIENKVGKLAQLEFERQQRQLLDDIRLLYREYLLDDNEYIPAETQLKQLLSFYRVSRLVNFDVKSVSDALYEQALQKVITENVGEKATTKTSKK